MKKQSARDGRVKEAKIVSYPMDARFSRCCKCNVKDTSQRKKRREGKKKRQRDGIYHVGNKM